MSTPAYNWTRFFCTRQSKLNFSDNGFLYDPESDYGKIINPDAKKFDEIIDYPCLLLIGEPGIGKSFILSQGCENIKAQIEPEGHFVEGLDLRGYSSEDRLYRELFETQRFRDWLSGSNELHLFLDSFDECLIHLRTLTPLLTDKIKHLPIDRLKLRIACRTSELPTLLETELIRIWGENNVGIYELAPLRKKDVIESLNAHGLDADEVLSEIIERNAVPFASNPVTLSFFIDLLRNEGALPTSAFDLFYQGCKCLCSEPNENIRGVTRNDRLSSDEILIIASRIAALTLLANKDTISYTRLDTHLEESEIHLNQLISGIEHFHNNDISIDRTSILNSFNTPLFNSRGQEKIGWAHYSYSEFLTAYYFKHNSVPTKQILSMIIHPDESERRVVPQLHGLAIWLSLISSEILDEIIDIEPELILKGSFNTLEDDLKEKIVRQLLQKIEAGTITNGLINYIRHFNKLRFPRMPDVLREYIFNPEKSPEIRTISILIAEFCNLTELEPELLDLIHNNERDYELRKHAALFISEIGTEEAKETLVQFARGETGLDPELELLGIGLKIAWPQFISADELFSFLPPPRSDPIGGYYHRFLSSYLVPHLDIGSLPLALDWVSSLYESDSIPFFFERLADKIMTRALNDLDNSVVLEHFALSAWVRLSHYKPITSEGFNMPVPKPLIVDTNLRHNLIIMMSQSQQTYNRYVYRLVRSETPLVFPEDIEWLIEQLNQSESTERKEFWADLIRFSYVKDDVHHFNLIYYAVQENPEISEKFLWLLGPIELDSEVANQMREYYENEQRIRLNQQPSIVSPSPYEASIKKLVEIENGNITAWIDLNRFMLFELNGRTTLSTFDYDLTIFPVWQIMNEEEKQRVSLAAEQYLIHGEPRTSEWLGSYTCLYSDLAGFRALHLLLNLRRNFLDEISEDIIHKWASIVIASPDSPRGTFETRRAMVKKVFQIAPNQIIEALSSLIDYENERNSIYSLNYVHGINESSLNSMLLRKIVEIDFRPECIGKIIRFLLKNQYPPVEEYTQSLICQDEPSEDLDRKKRIIAAVNYVNFSSRGWAYCWPIVQSDTNFGRKIIEAIATSHYDNDFWRMIPLEQTYDLLQWIMEQYPLEDDPDHPSGVIYSSGPRDAIVRLRSRIIDYVKNHGSIKSSQLLNRLASEFQQYPRLRTIASEASVIMRHQTWIPPTPETILRVIKDSTSKLIKNGTHLLNVIKESLILLEQTLQGESPASRDLWDKVTRNKYRPNDENAFSDYIKRHFDEDVKDRGIIVNREVEIRRGEGAGVGERTDIHIDCVLIKNGQIVDTITAIVETKGCWHSQLRTAMETQLVQRYLHDNQCRHGLYLVGWFDCDQWDARDRRRRACQRNSIEELSDHLATQSSELSEQYQVVLDFQIVNAALR